MKNTFLTHALRNEVFWSMTQESLDALKMEADKVNLPEGSVRTLAQVSAEADIISRQIAGMTKPASQPQEGAEGQPASSASGKLFGGMDDPEEDQDKASAAGQGTGYLTDTTIRPMMMPNGKQIAVVNFIGTIISRAPKWAASYGYISPQLFAAEMIALADNPAIGAIVINMDSNGGTVAGTAEAADAVAYAAKRKNVVVCVNDMMLSGGLWIGTQARSIVVSPTALTGSIGVITSHTDLSGWYKSLGVVISYIRSVPGKARGQSGEPLDEEAKAERQALVDSLHQQFILAVSAGRKLAKTKVSSQWATGKVWVGSEAVSNGLADRMASLSLILAELTGNAVPPKTQADKEDTPPGILDDEEDDTEDAKASEVQKVFTYNLQAGTSAKIMLPEGASFAELKTAEGEHVSSWWNGTVSVSADVDTTYKLTATYDRAEEAPEVTVSHNTVTHTATLQEGDNTKPQMEAHVMNIKDIQAKLAAGQALSAEESTFLAGHLAAQGSAAAGAATPSTPTPAATATQPASQPSNAAAADQVDWKARAEQAEANLAAEREEKTAKAFSDKALALGQPAEFGATLRRVAEALAGSTDGEAVLAKLEAAVSASGTQKDLTKEIGTAQKAQAKPDGETLAQEYSRRVTAEQKEHGGTRTQAAERVFKADPEFQRRYASGA